MDKIPSLDEIENTIVDLGADDDAEFMPPLSEQLAAAKANPGQLVTAKNFEAEPEAIDAGLDTILAKIQALKAEMAAEKTAEKAPSGPAAEGAQPSDGTVTSDRYMKRIEDIALPGLDAIEQDVMQMKQAVAALQQRLPAGEHPGWQEKKRTVMTKDGLRPAYTAPVRHGDVKLR